MPASKASGASGVASNVLRIFWASGGAAGHPSCHKGRSSDAEFDGICWWTHACDAARSAVAVILNNAVIQFTQVRKEHRVSEQSTFRGKIVRYDRVRVKLLQLFDFFADWNLWEAVEGLTNSSNITVARYGPCHKTRGAFSLHCMAQIGAFCAQQQKTNKKSQFQSRILRFRRIFVHSCQTSVQKTCVFWKRKERTWASKSATPINTMSKRYSMSHWEHNTCIVVGCGVNIDVLDCSWKTMANSFLGLGARPVPGWTNVPGAHTPEMDLNVWLSWTLAVFFADILKDPSGLLDPSVNDYSSMYIVEACWRWFVRMQIDVNNCLGIHPRLQNFHFIKENQCRTIPQHMDQPSRLVASVHWFDSKRESWLQAPCCNVAEWKNGLRGPYALKLGFGFRDGTLFVDVCCDRCHCEDHANQFHLLPGRKQPGSVESLVHSWKNVVLYRFVQ